MAHLSAVPDDALLLEERERANRFRFAKDRDAFVSTRTVLRRLLSAYTGTAPEEITLTAGPRQKPLIANNEIHFNVSHSGGMSLLAFAHTDVGVDIEKIRPVSDMDSIVERNFAPAEQQEWRQLPPTQREEAFFLAWTRKEAYIKALGEGLHCPLSSFAVSLNPDAPPIFRNVPDWSLHSFTLPGFTSALAIQGEKHEGKAWLLNSLSTAPPQ